MIKDNDIKCNNWSKWERNRRVPGIVTAKCVYRRTPVFVQLQRKGACYMFR